MWRLCLSGAARTCSLGASIPHGVHLVLATSRNTNENPAADAAGSTSGATAGDDRPRCLECDRTFKNLRGLGVHRRSQHAEVVHAEIAENQAERVARGGTKSRWTIEELSALAKKEVELLLAGAENLNQGLHFAFPARTLEAIKGQRRSLKYRDMVAAHTLAAELASDRRELEAEVDHIVENQAGVVEEPSMDQKFVDWALSCGNPPLILQTLLDAMGSANRRQVGVELEALLTSLAPPVALSSRVAGQGEPLRARELRKQQYRKTQKLFTKNRRRAAEVVLSGSWKASESTVDEGDQKRFWKAVFESPRKYDKRPVGPAKGNLNMAAMCEVVTVAEATKLLGSLAKTAPGPDGITNFDLKAHGPLVAASIMNAVLFVGAPPANFRLSRTVLIPKCDNPGGPGDFRPLSIGNAYCRLFHKLLAGRAVKLLPLNETQRAFRSVDGTAANIAVMSTILQDARQNIKPVHVAFIDLKKAFDSVSHESIIRAARRMGFPEPLIGYLAQYYAFGSTLLFDEEIQLTNGVRQGDPLSPILFNGVIDEGIEEVQALDCGYLLNGHVFKDLAFADDLTLLAQTKTGLQLSVDSILETLSLAGLEPNARKCRTLRIAVEGKRKRWYCDPTPFCRVDEQQVPTLTVEDAYRYLGVQLAARGLSEVSATSVGKFLENICKAPLKPQQRLYILNRHMVPKLLHPLVLGKVTRKLLLNLDRQVRSAVRLFLRLPKDTPVGYFHSAVQDGGLGVPCFSTSVPRLIIRRSEKLGLCQDKDVKACVTSATYTRAAARRVPSTWKGLDLSQKENERTFWKDRLLSSFDGSGLGNVSCVPIVNSWVSSGTRLMKGYNYINAVKLRGNLMPTGARSARGRGGAPMCDAGCNARESLAHIVQSCSRTHGERVRRHNRVVHALETKFTQLGYEVVPEPLIPTALGNRKPDLLLHGFNKAYVIDATVTSDSCICQDLDFAYRQKTRYYNTQDIRTYVQNLYPEATVDFGAVVLDWRGALSVNSSLLLTELGVPSSFKELLAVMTLEGGVAEYLAWCRRTTRANAG